MTKKSSIALGFFDGVHPAHQQIISAAVQRGRETGMRSVALTFDLSPETVLLGVKPPLLTYNSEKQRLISRLGAECVFLRTDRALLSLSGEEFIRRVLMEQFNIGAAFCGFNYTFGRDRLSSGDLEGLGREMGFETFVFPQALYGGLPISSSRVRELIAKGDMEETAALLGRPYSITGIVERGKRLGRTMGFPTVNIYPSSQRVFMPRGVYATEVAFGGEEHIGVTNVGINPTVRDSGIRIETHIPNFCGDLYGVEVETKFLRFVRPERKFATVEELFAQIRRDTDAVLGKS